ncbi:SRPBCC family protein [Baekduia sp.]|uniref:SRPBCC family protein n=1 Tax=Baekduia sp. TaxID=2600305 RepID=UPI002DFFBCB0|nr:SRPBCC family protein [Baekduia sp.]
MTDVVDRRRIAATPRDVWRVLCDIERYADWAPWTLHARRVDRPAGLGVAYEEHGRVLSPLVGPSRWRIVEFDVPRRQVHRAEAVRLAVGFDRIFELTSDGDGGTWLTLCLRYRPTLGVAGRGLDWALVRWLQARRITMALERFSRIVERAPGPTAVP